MLPLPAALPLTCLAAATSLPDRPVRAEVPFPVGNRPEAFGERIRADLKLWADMVRLTGVKVE